MILQFKTRRNASGHRKIIAFNTDTRQATQENNYFATTDFIEIKSKDRENIIKELEQQGYIFKDCNTFRKENPNG